MSNDRSLRLLLSLSTLVGIDMKNGNRILCALKHALLFSACTVVSYCMYGVDNVMTSTTTGGDQ